MTPDEIRKLGSGMPLDRLVENALHPDRLRVTTPPLNYSGTGGGGWEFWAMLDWAKERGFWTLEQYDHGWLAYLEFDADANVSATAPTLPHAVALCVALAAAKEGVTT